MNTAIKEQASNLPEDRLLSAEEARKYLSLSSTTFYRRSLEPDFPTGYKLCKGRGGAKRFRLSEIDAWVNRQADAGGEG